MLACTDDIKTGYDLYAYEYYGYQHVAALAEHQRNSRLSIHTEKRQIFYFVLQEALACVGLQYLSFRCAFLCGNALP